MGVSLVVVLLGLAVAGVGGGAWLAQAAVRRREDAQARIQESHSHLAPRGSWPVAYASGPHMDSVFKIWTWEDVGVLHLYDDALAFFGETLTFEIARDSIARVEITTYMRTNPMVPWLEIETEAGLRHLFCAPRGVHVGGMRERIDEIHRAVDAWSRGGASRPLLIG